MKRVTLVKALVSGQDEALEFYTKKLASKSLKITRWATTRWLLVRLPDNNGDLHQPRRGQDRRAKSAHGPAGNPVNGPARFRRRAQAHDLRLSARDVSLPHAGPLGHHGHHPLVPIEHVHFVECASHWPQWDRPAEVAKLILQTAGQLLRRHPALRAGPRSCSAKESWYRCGMAPNTANSRPGGQVEQRWAPLPVRIWEASSP